MTGPNVINEGTVTFRVFNGSVEVGQDTTSATVSNGAASVSYNLPPALTPGTYTVQAQYNGTTNYIPSIYISSATQSLKVTQAVAAVNFVANPVTTAYNGKADESVPIHIVVTSSGVPVNEGTVTLTAASGPRCWQVERSLSPMGRSTILLHCRPEARGERMCSRSRLMARSIISLQPARP